MKIPKDSVGLVIGRQGANIREIQVPVHSVDSTVTLEMKSVIYAVLVSGED